MKILAAGTIGGPAIVSVYDYSGRWPHYYAEAGYRVVLVDLKHGDNTLTRATVDEVVRSVEGYVVRGVLLAPPCTDFSGSGAQYWPAKDADGRTAKSVALVRRGLWIRDRLNPTWWVLENPSGRLPRCVPGLGRPAYYFHPHHYAGWAPDPEADAYTKYTGMWGNAAEPVRDSRPPIRACSQGSWIQKLGGKSERTKMLRSLTPLGYSRAFHAANP